MAAMRWQQATPSEQAVDGREQPAMLRLKRLLKRLEQQYVGALALVGTC